MSRRNDSNFLKHAGNSGEPGVFSFGYFALDKQRKVTRQEAKQTQKLDPRTRGRELRMTNPLK
jgi:hypothetical protein